MEISKFELRIANSGGERIFREFEIRISQFEFIYACSRTSERSHRLSAAQAGRTIRRCHTWGGRAHARDTRALGTRRESARDRSGRIRTSRREGDAGVI